MHHLKLVNKKKIFKRYYSLMVKTIQKNDLTSMSKLRNFCNCFIAFCLYILVVKNNQSNDPLRKG